MAKDFDHEIAEHQLVVRRKQEQIDQEAALDGIYVIRTSVPAEEMDAVCVVRAYKNLAHLEYGFRTLKSFDLQIRPVHHYTERRVRAHAFLCMLSLYVCWHLERAWAELLFRDEEPPLNQDPVAPKQRSVTAPHKASRHQLEDGSEAHSWRTLMRALSEFSRAVVTVGEGDSRVTFSKLTSPTSLHTRAFALAGVNARGVGRTTPSA